ncbi:MAG: CcoQ/FixQ family Cbb3-type cytochrome c oxidase assembly chaperone [Gammaproteobacteria bacterium]|nr:CcoQ/FixQ family Cbb3-type cytochrome c oxidase assembly chaperone [Gammaproteobacteria bacterium]
MDINELRTLILVTSFVVFLGIVAWAYSARRKAGFDKAARSVVDDDDERDVDTARRERK